MSFLHSINPETIPDHLRDRDDLHLQREVVLQKAWMATFFAGLSAYLVWGYSISWNIDPGLQALIWAGLAGALFFTVNRRLSFQFRAIVLIAILATFSLSELLSRGLQGTGALFLLSVIGLATAFFGLRTGAIILLIAGVATGTAGWGAFIAAIPWLSQWFAPRTDLAAWVSLVFSLFLCGYYLLISIHQFSWEFSRVIQELRHSAQLMEQARNQSERQFRLRLEEMAHKNALLEAIGLVATKIVSETEPSSLLQTAVDTIQKQFLFYYVAIFLPDETREYAVLHAGSGEAGKIMLERHHSLKIGEVGIVGYVMSKGEPRISGNVEEDPAHYKNPYLPNTCSEMGIPMKMNGQVIGVLDVQSDHENAFSADDVEILQTIADQLAGALEKSRIFTQMRQTLEEVQDRTRQSPRQSWQQHLRNSNRRFAFRYHNARVEPFQANPGEFTRVLWKKDAPTSTAHEDASQLALPIKLRGQVIGLVQVKFGTRQVSPEMVNLLEQAVERMALSLDNVRLVEEIQARAERERMVGEIASKVRSATDIESILKITASELGNSLGVSEVLVQLTPGGNRST